MQILNTNLFQLYQQTCTCNPNKIAVQINKSSYTYAALKQNTDAFAAALIELNLQLGARVIIQAGNGLETIVAFWASLQAGAVPVIISPDLTAAKTLHIIEDAGATHYVGALPRDLAVDAWQNTCLQHVIINSERTIKHPNQYRYGSLFKNINQTTVWQRRLDIDLATIIYTSGSTGEAKGVMLSQHNMLAATNSLLTYLNYTFTDKIISALPLAFDYGLYQMIMAFTVGATLILEENLLLAMNFLKKIELQQASILPAVPALITLINDAAKRRVTDLRSIRMVTNTAASLQVAHINMLKNMFPNAQIYSMYGLTECKRVSYLPPEDLEQKPNSVGIAIPNTELWIIDEYGQKVTPNTPGQLVVRGSTVMQGYWNKPELTAAKIMYGLNTGAKLLYTGDICYLDSEGYLYFCGRMDEMIKTRGVKVSPKEIEDVISQLAEVKEVAVIAKDSLLYGAEICACIALVENATLTRGKIREYCQKNLENVKIPSQIHLLPALPRTANAKVDKFALQQLLIKQKPVLA